MRSGIWRKWGAAVLPVILLLAAATAQGAERVDLFDYMMPAPLTRCCNYTYVSPPGFPGFTLRVSPITSGKYAGKYYWGDWNTPNNETDVWRIVSWNATNLYMWASQLGGDFANAVVIPRAQTLDTVIDSPVPGNTSYPWYFTFRESLTVPAGTFYHVLLDLVLDTHYGPNSVNYDLGLGSLPAITSVTYLAQGIGEIATADIDANSGQVNYAYVLQSTRMYLPALPMLLMN